MGGGDGRVGGKVAKVAFFLPQTSHKQTSSESISGFTYRITRVLSQLSVLHLVTNCRVKKIRQPICQDPSVRESSFMYVFEVEVLH